VSETTRFTEDIMAAANEKARKVMEEAENERERLVEDANASIVREANEIVRNAHSEAEGIKRREISEVRHRIKLMEQSEKDRILNSVFDEVKARLRETARDEDSHLKYLGRLAAEAIRQLGMEQATIRMNNEDLKRIDVSGLKRELERYLTSSVSVDVSKEPISASGGVVVSSHDGTVRIVNTFEQRFEALEPKLLIEAGRLLFSERLSE
jgi:vacuolar-type H+-ATPase subunit E/Vma4